MKLSSMAGVLIKPHETSSPRAATAPPLRRAAFAGLLAIALAGCNSTSGGLLSGIRPTPPEPVGGTPLPIPSATSGAQAPVTETPRPEPTGQARVAAITTNALVQFAPVVGATEQAVVPLSRRLATRAAERGIRLAGPGDRGTTHIMKGYFSAISEAGQTTVIYVWDVLDPSGNRLHRIQGQAKTRGGNGDAWSSVSAVTMETVADNTINSLASWLANQQS